ncbi:MAG: hypothetical protein GY795_16040 [Desulfobacterales bacterium]|nr:hypothetical protein [Desulfobacterales bacterium]
MKYEIQLSDFDKYKGFSFYWESGFEIEAMKTSSGVVIKANRAGLISLARHLLTLSQDSIPKGHHIHLDDLNGLEDSSCELIFEKI